VPKPIGAGFQYSKIGGGEFQVAGLLQSEAAAMAGQLSTGAGKAQVEILSD